MSLKYLLKQSTPVVILSVLLMVIVSILNLVIAFGLSKFVDNVVFLNKNIAIFYLIIVIILWIISYYITYLYQKCVNKIREKSLSIYRSSISKKIKNSTSIDRDFYISTLINDSAQIDSTINILFNSISYALRSIFSLFGLLYLHWILAIVNIGVIIFNYFLTKKLEKKVTQNQKERSSKNQKFFSNISDILKGYSVWNVYNSKHQLFKRLMHTTSSFEESRENMNNVDAKVTTYQYLLSGTGQIISSFSCFLLVVFGYLSVGSIFAEGELSGGLSNSIEVAFNGLLQSKGINVILKERTKQLPQEDTSITDINDYDIQIKDLSFSYPDKPIFNQLNLEFVTGKKYLIIGPSGFGKTTLLNLLSKTITDYSGSISLGNYNYSSLTNYTIHHYIGYVEQAPYIFKDTLKNNITLYNNYSDDDLKQAMDVALVSEFFSLEKLNDVIDPNELSGGQKQRIALARELINNHKIILFDESINALDKEMTNKIIQQLLQLSQTVILVSHSYNDSIIHQFDQVIDFSKY